jgi:predicted esterase
MTDRMDFFRRSEAMMAFYAEGKYLDALNVTGQLAAEFPAENATTSYWRVCLLSRAGKTEEALMAMSAAMEQGMWWSEEQLRADDDLAPLQGLPAFELMVAECNTRRVEAQKDAKPDMLIRLPARNGFYPSIIALHGRGSSPDRDFRYWESILHMGWMLVMPQSSQLGSPNSYIWDDTARSGEEIANHYKQLLEDYSIDQERVLLAGFSQGAGLAIQICLRGMIPARGFLAVNPGRIAIEDLDELLNSKHNLRGYLVVGGRDPRYEMFTQLHALLNQNGIPCEMEDHPQMGHEFPKDFDRSIRNALAFLLA